VGPDQGGVLVESGFRRNGNPFAVSATVDMSLPVTKNLPSSDFLSA
jgi:hypothetical protein